MVAGRVEAKMVVPSSAAVSITIPNGAGATSVTAAPAGSYYLTAAGGVSGLLATMETALNSNAVIMGFPRTAAATALAIGYGTWTSGAGWLMQEASGNLSPVFGATTLTATSLTYQNAGIKTGDYAIGFDTTTDNADGGNVFDVIATDDLIVAWVGYSTGAPSANSSIITKFGTGPNAGWKIDILTTGTLSFDAFSAGAQNFSATLTLPTNAWYVGIAVVDRSTGKARVGVRTLAGTTTISAEQTATAVSYTTATGTFRVGQRSDAARQADTKHTLSAVYVVDGSGVAAGLSANLSTALTNFASAISAAWGVSLGSDGRITIDWTGYATPTWSWSWTSTTLRDVCGFTANISNVTTAQTGTEQAEGIWLPDAPLNCDNHPSMVPVETDARSSESPTKVMLTLVGNEGYAHTNVRWQRCPVDRIRERSATLANASLEYFYRQCIVGLGDISWFSPGGDLQIYWSNAGVDTLLGSDGVDADGSGVSGWRPQAIPRFADLARPSQEGWVGQFDVRFPRLVSSG